MNFIRATLLASLALCCCTKTDPGVTFLTTSESDALVAASLEFVPVVDQPLHHAVVNDPKREITSRGGFVVAVVTRTDCTECYRLDGDAHHLTVTGGLPLGVQYGVAHAMELFGYRFNHPWKTFVPKVLIAADTSALGQEYAPETARRMVHLHTLHPIEALYDFWVPGDANLEGARRTLDFVIKNRGNAIQWAALNDIINDPTKYAAWKAHTQAILETARARGLKVGIALQLLGISNLQNAFDLVDDLSADPSPEIHRRLSLLHDDLNWDWYNLSFGEFSGADPQVFIDRINSAYSGLQDVSPGAEMTATIHVGNYANLRVTYMNQTQLYYFLVRYANPAITPWIHTVMFYDLFEDTGGAYLHDNFDEHKAFLEDRLRANKPVGYFPEQAYWVAFDNSVPLYLPLYMRSRWLDISNLREAGSLQDHVLFTSGWEWGYWQTVVATLRMNWKLPATWDEPVKMMFSPLGENGAKVADLIRRLAEVQHHGLIEQRLIPYLEGRDQIIDAGDHLGIVSQPDRIEYSELAALPADQRAAFYATVLVNLSQHADDVSALDSELASLNVSGVDPFLAEVVDGFEITAHRTRFSVALYKATQAYLEGGSPTESLAKADAELAAAKTVVARRRAAFFDPDVKSIIRDTPNPTFYQYGYLREADQLCYWERERAQARQLILQTGDVIPGCIL